MFRRGFDISWPLILILAALFFQSLRLPREWERIARATRLELVERSSPRSENLSIAAVSPGKQSPLEIFRAMPAADHVASNAADCEAHTATANRELLASGADIGSYAKVQVEGPHLSKSAAATVAAVVESAKPNVAGSPISTTGANVELAANTTLAQSAAPAPAVKSNDFEPVEPDSADDVRVLRDAPTSDVARVANDAEPRGGAGLPDNASAMESEVRRLPPPDGQTTETKPADLPHPVSNADPQPTRVETESETAPAIQKNVSNPLRSVVPEPELPTSQPATSLPAETTQVRTAENAKPMEKANSATEPVSKAMPVELPVKALGRAWAEPANLLLQLDELTRHEATRAWATEAAVTVRKLGPAISVGAPETSQILQHLELLTRESTTLLLKDMDNSVAQNLSRTAHSLERHVTVWMQIGKMGGLAAADAPAPRVDPRRINKCLNDIDQLTGDSSEGHAWRKYLLVESLRDWAARRRNGEERLPHDLAQQVLTRLNPMSVSSHQRQFLTTGPMADLHQEVLRHAAEPVQSNRLLEHLETYETSGLASDARVLARDCQFLSVGTGAAQRELGERIEMHYRNANLRIAVTAELLNRMMPKREPEYAAVQDVIQGAQVRGQSLMASEVAVRLIPDPHHVRLALEVNGEVASLTRSTAGPATFYSDSESSYIARKPVEITLRGISMGETEVSVDNSSKLRGVSTSLDGVPIFGRVAKNVAQSQHDQKLPAAEAEIREKIAAKAKDRVDHETSGQIAIAAKRLNDEVIGPMDSLMLDPMMIAAETTDKRFSMRIRLAGPDQLGGHTPRPQAPADSLASVQLHESMLNNMLERLELDGQTFDLAGLGKRLAERLHRFQPKPVDADQEDVKITFAAKDALHVRCNDGRIEVTLSIARLSKGPRNKWKDFQVRAYYRPVVQGRSVDLAREGVVQLIVPRISVASQLALRGVFSKVFNQKEPIHATPEAFVKNPKLDGIVITQFVIDDGWIGAAIGPQRVVTTQRTMTRR